MVFGKIVGLVESAAAPVDEELALANAVANPVEAHIDSLGAPLFHRVVGNTSCGVIVCDNGCRGLWVSKFFETDAEGACLLAIVE